MARLVPYPLGALVSRLTREIEVDQAVFDLPLSKQYRGLSGKTLAVSFQGERAASPLGPAAGPHTQMAQNLALSWLAGSRILELKTVQIQDELTIPRPCIDMRTVGFNAEWSQELKLEESLEEYVKGSMLVVMLRDGGLLPDATPGATDNATLFDMSVGYDLAGIRSERVRAFIDGMRDAGASIDRLRREIPARCKRLRELDYPTCLSSNITLSTFHGCPPDEIERIVDFLLRELHLSCVVKLNPMLLGKQETDRLLYDVLGYHTLRAPDIAFDRDLEWGRAVEMVDRLGATARACGLHFGVKFTNTLVVENDASFLPPSAGEIYLSGPPLHVLAMELVRRFRAEFGDTYPVSFSAGIERHNFPDAVALGLVPITTCSDLLKPGGYGRMPGYYRELSARMDSVGASTVDEFVLHAYGSADVAWERVCAEGPPAGAERAEGRPAESRRAADGQAVGRSARARGSAPSGERPAVGTPVFAQWVSAARLLNTQHYVTRLLERAQAPDSRYDQAHHTRSPKKIGRHLQLFDCITCDKCVPVCPNDAVFAFAPARGPIAKVMLRARPGAAGIVADAGSAGVRTRTWDWLEGGALEVDEQHQLATFADFCNECGNCDVFCPEDGGPYVMKPRFFGSRESWERARPLEGLFVARKASGDLVLGRVHDTEYRLEVARDELCFEGYGGGDGGDDGGGDGGGHGGGHSHFRVRFRRDNPRATLRVEVAAEDEIDLTWCFVLDRIRAGVLDGGQVNYVNAAAGDPSAPPSARG